MFEMNISFGLLCRKFHMVSFTEVPATNQAETEAKRDAEGDFCRRFWNVLESLQRAILLCYTIDMLILCHSITYYHGNCVIVTMSNHSITCVMSILTTLAPYIVYTPRYLDT